MNLDLRSLAIMAGLIGVVMGFVLLGLRRSFPARIPGMRTWGAAPLLCAASTLFYGLDGRLTPLAIVLGGNALLLAGVACFYFGSQRFYGLRSSWRIWLAIGLAMLAGLTVFLLVHPDYRIRVALFTATLAAVVLAHVRLLRRKGRGFAPRFTMTVLALQAIVLLVRAVTTFWLDAADTSRFAPSSAQMAYIAAFNFSVLLVCIGVLLMASERMRAEFEYLATHDGLTGALTRRAIFQACTVEWERWKRYGTAFSLLLLDIDHFKRINDQWGHQAGDKVLADFSALAAANLRKVDRLGRYGGEEFLVLLPPSDGASARAMAERLRHIAEQSLGGLRHPGCTISVGVATVHATDANVDALLARADAALYQAKNRGRNQVVAQEPDGTPNVV